MHQHLKIKELVAAARAAAPELPPAAAQLMRDVASRLDVTFSALCEKSREVTTYEATVTNLTAQVQGLAADNADLMTAAKQVIKMNRQHARDKHGNPDIAESWACVKVLRKARAKANTDAALAEIRAQGVDAFAADLGEVYQKLRAGSEQAHALKAVVFRASHFSEQLRKEQGK